jgi:hypothetical protein
MKSTKNLCTLERTREAIKIALHSHVGASGRYRTRIRNADGTPARDWSPWEKNLILDQGLNQLAVSPNHWGSMLVHAAIGTGNLAVQKTTTGAGVTLNQPTTNHVTSSGPFFAATDVGALIKFDAGSAGQEMRILAFNSTTDVTVDTVGTHAAASGVVYQVQQTTLQSYHALDNGTFEADAITYAVPAGMPTLSFKRGYQFPAEGAPVTLKEIGFTWSGAANPPLWSRVVIAGGGDALITGQIYEVEYLLTIQLPGGAAPAAVGDTSGGTWNTAGNYMVESALDAIYQAIDTTNNGRCLDPNCNGNNVGICTIIGAYAQRPVATNTDFNPGGTVTFRDSFSQDAYVAGSFTVTRHSHFNIGSSNGTVNGIGEGTNQGNKFGWDILFTTPVVKDNAHTLDFTHTVSWNRVLTN